jgi:tRNA(Ile2) C34 agmatinyltransferase TiaS
MKVHVFADADDRLKKDAGTARALRLVAEKAEHRVRAPHGYDVSVKAGRGPRGAFAQVIMRGPRAIFIEFGTRKQKPLAPLRNAIMSIRGTRV